jgi:chromosome segregation ATPase
LATSLELEARIEETERKIQSNYTETLEEMLRLKTQLNKLEQQTSRKTQSLKALDLALERLDRLIDSQIVRSKRAWEEYRRLEQECKQCALCPVQLDNLRAICKKTEELATDLLCYSLARFKQSERQH